MYRENQIEPMLTVKDVAKILHVHANTVRRWSDLNLIKVYRITRRGDRRYRQEDIYRFLLSQQIQIEKVDEKGKI